jgi:hypothetical protein
MATLSVSRLDLTNSTRKRSLEAIYPERTPLPTEPRVIFKRFSYEL